MNPFKWTQMCVRVAFFSRSHLVRLLLLLVSDCSRSLSQNDDHMFEILRTEMTQLAIASELTRSHYLLVRTVSIFLVLKHTNSTSPICSRNLFAKILPHERSSFFFLLLLLIFIPSFFFRYFVWLGSLSLSLRLSRSYYFCIICRRFFSISLPCLVHSNFNVDSFRFLIEKCARFTWTAVSLLHSEWQEREDRMSVRTRRKANERKGLLFIIR